MAPQLPVEVLGRIVSCLFSDNGNKSSPDILNLLVTSQAFKTETERLIYASLALKGLRQVLQCLRTIDKRNHLARLVRGLTLSVPLTAEAQNLPIFEMFQNDEEVARASERHRLRNANLGRVLKPFSKLVTRTLAKLANLQEYSLSMGLLQRLPRNEEYFVAMFLPSPASFKLRRLAIDVNWTPSVRRFLITQPSIADLLAPEFFPLVGAEAGTFPRTALPNLRGLAASSQVAAQLVPGRPVRKVIIKELVPRASTLGKISDALPALAQSTSKLKILDISVREVGMAIEALWPTMALLFPELETIVLRRGTFSPESTDLYAIYRSESFCEGLASFKKLKHIALPGLSPYKIYQDAGILPPELAHAGQFVIHADINAQIVQGPPGPHGPPVFGPPLPPHLAGNQQPPPANHNVITGTFTVPLGVIPAAGGGLQLPGIPNFLQGLQGLLGLGGPPPGILPEPQPGVVNTPNAVPQPAGPHAAALPPPGPGNPIHFAQTFFIQGGTAMPIAGLQQVATMGQPQQNPPDGDGAGGLPILQAGEQQAMMNVLTQATNQIITMLAGGGLQTQQPNDQTLAEDEAEFPEEEDVPELEVIPGHADEEQEHSAAEPSEPTSVTPTPEPEDGPPINGPPGFELLTFQGQNWPLNILTQIDPETGAAVENPAPGGSRIAQGPDPKREEALNKAQREAKEEELKILETWSLGGYGSELHSASFHIIPHRRTIWTKKGTGMVITNLEGIDTRERVNTHLGDWEVEYHSG